jgi:peptidoglycan/LPS O-acetylase OafA/YrhL
MPVFFAGGQSKFPVKTFYLKRVARIYPLYVLAILILLFFHFAIKRIDTSTVLLRIPFEITGIQRWLYAGSFNYPGWSVSCEVFFYLLFPLMAVYLRGHRRGFAVLVWVYFMVSLLITQQLAMLLKSPLPFAAAKVVGGLYLNPVLLLSVFLFGMLAGRCFMERSTPFFKNKFVNVAALVLSTAIILLTKYCLPNGSWLLKGGVLAPVYFVFVMAITGFGKAETKLFSNKAFVFLGEASYAMYILQYPVYVFYTRYVNEVKTASALGCFALVLILLSALAHVLIEKPAREAILMRYGRRKAVI